MGQSVRDSLKEIALVTGGSNGIGRAVVSRLTADNYLTVNLDISSPPEDQAGIYRAVDLADPAALETALKTLASEFRISRIVNNVGTIRPNAIMDVTECDIAAAVALNWVPALQTIKAALPRMIGDGFGRIVNISSRSALGRPERSVYSMTKGGLIGFTRSWASQLAGAGITINAIGPGPIETEMFNSTHPPGDPKRERVIAMVPVGRMGRPEEVAQAVSFFLDERSSFITGQTIYVCGGMSLGLQPI